MPDYQKSDILDYKRDKDILRIIEEDFARSEAKYQTLKEDMESDLKKYWMIYDSSSEPSASEMASANLEQISCLKMPTARAHIETFLSIIMANLFPQHAEWLYAKPKATHLMDKETNVYQIAEELRQYRLYNLRHNINYYDKMADFVLQGLNTYWTVSYLRWHRRGGWVYTGQGSEHEASMIERIGEAIKHRDASLLKKRKYPDFNENFGFKEIVEDHAELEIIHTFNGFPDPRGGRNWERNAFFGDETRVPWHELYANQFNPDANEGYGSGLYYNLDALWNLAHNTDSEKTPEEQLNENLGDTSAVGTSPKPEDRKQNADRNTVILRRYWTRNAIITTDKDCKVVVAKQRIADWRQHLFKWQWGQERTFAAQSLLRLLAPLDQERDAIINHTLENWRRINSGTYFYNDTMLSPEVRGKPALPGGRGIPFQGDPRTAVLYDRPPDISPSTYQFVQLFDRALESVSGMGSNTLSQFFPGGRRQATEVNYVNQAGENRQGQRIVQLQLQVVDPQQNAITQLEIRHMILDVPFAFKTDRGVAVETIDRTWIRKYAKMVEFRANGAMVVNQRQMEAVGLQNAVGLTSNNQMMAQLVNWPWVTREIFRRIAFMVDTDDAVKVEPPDKISIPPDMELALMKLGWQLDPHATDDHELHLETHEKQLEEADQNGSDTNLIKTIMKHIEKTEQAAAAERPSTQVGMQGQASPGQIMSQMTPGTQAANFMNPQIPGQPAPTDETRAVR